MADARAITRVLDELLWTLRRAGFAIGTSQAIDAVRAAHAVGLDERGLLREAIASIVVHRSRERPRFDAAFDAFFAPGSEHRSIWDRLAARGFSTEEIDEIRTFLKSVAGEAGEAEPPLGTLLGRGADLDRLLHLAGAARAAVAHSKLQLGFYAHRLLQRMGMTKAYDQLALLKAHLADAFGEERSAVLAAELKKELAGTADHVREYVHDAYARSSAELQHGPRKLETSAFTLLSDVEILEVRRAVRRFAHRLRGGERVRLRRAQKGRVDPHRTFRRALATGGVPFQPARKKRRRDKPRLMLVCDVSDSVRSVACFMLEFAYAAQELFERTRSFVFVSELGETTHLFATESVTVALGHAYGGSIVSVRDNSNYGRALRAFESRYLDAVDRRTTVVILGDGRTNYHDDAAEVLDRIRTRARALLWLCPEGRGDWSLGDSAMSRYASKCTQVLEVRSARDLEGAGRAIVARR